MNTMIYQAQQDEVKRKEQELEMYKNIMEAGTAAREEEDRLQQHIESLTARLKTASRTSARSDNPRPRPGLCRCNFLGQ